MRCILKNLTNDELKQLIGDKVYNLYEKNLKEYKDDAVIPSLIMQMSVYATLEVLEELGLLTLPKKQ